MCDVQSILDAAEYRWAVPLQLTRCEPPNFGSPEWKAKTMLWRDHLHKWCRWKRRVFSFYPSEPSDWVSYVCTLQEAHICPNVILAEEEWKVLIDTAGQPMSLQELFALVHVNFTQGTWATLVLSHSLTTYPEPRIAQCDKMTELNKDEKNKQQVPTGPRQLEAMAAKPHPSSSSVDSRINPLIHRNDHFALQVALVGLKAIIPSLGITYQF